MVAAYTLSPCTLSVNAVQSAINVLNLTLARNTLCATFARAINGSSTKGPLPYLGLASVPIPQTVVPDNPRIRFEKRKVRTGLSIIFPLICIVHNLP